MNQDKDYSVILSPLLSKRIDILENKISNIKNEFKIIINLLNEQNTFLKDNRNLYIDILNKINKQSKDNNIILKKNKELYNNILDKEKINDNPVIKSILTDKDSRIFSPVFESRIYNRYWRMTPKTKNKLFKSFIKSDK